MLKSIGKKIFTVLRFSLQLSSDFFSASVLTTLPVACIAVRLDCSQGDISFKSSYLHEIIPV